MNKLHELTAKLLHRLPAKNAQLNSQAEHVEALCVDVVIDTARRQSRDVFGQLMLIFLAQALPALRTLELLDISALRTDDEIFHRHACHFIRQLLPHGLVEARLSS